MEKSRINFKNYEIVDSGAKFYKSKDSEEGFYHVCDEYAPEYQASERATRKAITNIFGTTADFGTCDDVLTLISGKEYRRTAFINYLQHENYISPIIKACYN